MTLLPGGLKAQACGSPYHMGATEHVALDLLAATALEELGAYHVSATVYVVLERHPWEDACVLGWVLGAGVAGWGGWLGLQCWGGCRGG